MIRDRGGQFTDALDAALADAGIRVTKSPPQAPRANAIRERIIGTLRRQLLDRTLILGEHHSRLMVTEYLVHDKGIRPHRSLIQPSPRQAESTPPEPTNPADYPFRRKPILSGLTREYHVPA